MNAVTLTESKLYDLSRIEVPEYDRDYTPDYRELSNFRPILDHFEDTLNYRAVFRKFVGRVWNEAHIENDHRDALLMNEAYNLRVESFTLPSREAQAHALAVMRAREERTLAEVEALRAEVRRLREPIVEGDDYRLEAFWERAMEAATEANFCSEYDRIASALGGPERSVTYDVDLIVTVRSTVTVTVPRGTDITHYTLRDHVDLSEIESGIFSDIDWGDVEVSDYNEVDSY